MNEIFSSEEMKRFEQEQFLKRSSYSFMKKAGYEVFKFIKDNFKMNFIKCSLNEPFVVNQYGIPEPSMGKIVYPDIILVPLVAFDKNLNRLGYGAGYYDRLIQSIKKKKKIITIGLAFDFQELFSIPVSKYDQKLDYIITNKNVLQ